jgi:hypothetical protein
VIEERPKFRIGWIRQRADLITGAGIPKASGVWTLYTNESAITLPFLFLNDILLIVFMVIASS